MYRLWVLVSVLQRVDGVMHAHVISCAYACVYICVQVYIYLHFVCSEFYMHFTGVVGTSAWAGVYVTQVFFTPTYTSATHSLQVVHICVYVYMCAYACICIWMRMCVYDIA